MVRQSSVARTRQSPRFLLLEWLQVVVACGVSGVAADESRRGLTDCCSNLPGRLETRSDETVLCVPSCVAFFCQRIVVWLRAGGSDIQLAPWFSRSQNASRQNGSGVRQSCTMAAARPSKLIMKVTQPDCGGADEQRSQADVAAGRALPQASADIGVALPQVRCAAGCM